jgi:hypothetical protein
MVFFFRAQTGSVPLHDDMVTFVKLPTLDPENNVWPHKQQKLNFLHDWSTDE